MNSLDIGCGSNVIYEKRVAEPRAQINCDLLRPTSYIPNFVQCDAHHLPFRDEQFDRVLMYDVIEHLEAPVHALRDIHRTLKPDGSLTVATPNALNLPRIIRSMIRGFYTVYPTHILAYGYPELKQCCEYSGFRNVVIHYQTYARGHEKRSFYDVLTKLCPFKALKHKSLVAKMRKRAR